MARHIIGSPFGDGELNMLNDNFKQLFDDLNTATGTKQKLDDFLAGSGVVSREMIADGAVDGNKLADNTVYTRHLRMGAVTEDELSEGAVTGPKIADQSIGESKLADESVTFDKMAMASVGTLALRDNSVSTRKMPNGAVTEPKIEDGAVTVNKLGISSVSREKIRDNAINMRKINFSKTTRNLFDNNFIYGFSYFNPSEDFPKGSIHKTTLSDARAAVVKIEKDSDYTITIYEGGNNFRIALINEIPDDNNIPVEVLKTHLGEQSSTHRSYTITNDVNAEYLFVLTNLQSKIDAKVQIEKGVHSTSYVPNAYIPKEYMDPKITEQQLNDVVVPEETNFFVKNTQKNLFSGVYHTQYGFFSPSEAYPNGFIQPTTRATARAAIVKIEPDKTYTVTKYGGGDRFNVVLLGERPNRFNTPLGALYLYQGPQGAQRQSHTVENNYDAEYMFVYTNYDDDSYAELQVEEGTVSSIYQQGAYIPKEYIDPGILDDIEIPPSENGEIIIAQKDNKFNFSGDFHSLYEHNVIDDLVTNISNIKTSEINTLFNNLVSENNDIGVSTLLGADESGQDTFMFESVPPKYNDAPYVSSTKPDDGTPMAIPKIVITGGIHGNEKSPPISIYYFLKTLWENPQNDQAIDTLVQNVHFVFIPIVGAEGYDNDTYNNGSGHLNRDFPPHGNASRLATQMTQAALDAHQDMDFFIDFHNMFARDGMLGYVLTNDELWKRIGTNIYKDIGTRWSKKHSEIPKNRSHKFAVATEANNGTIGRYVQDVIGKPAGLLEVPRRNPFDDTAEEFDEFVIRLGVDILFNAVYALIRHKQ